MPRFPPKRDSGHPVAAGGRQPSDNACLPVNRWISELPPPGVAALKHLRIDRSASRFDQ